MYKLDDEYLESITAWLKYFFEDLPDYFFLPYPEGNKILKYPIMGTMFFKLINEGIFTDSKSISRKIALDVGILFPHTLVEHLIKNDKLKGG
jgi:hypothetical protein